jgi:hypothetical protein
MPQNNLSPAEICEASVVALGKVLGEIEYQVTKTPKVALRTITDKVTNKNALRVDLYAEDRFEMALAGSSKDERLSKIIILGEERIEKDPEFKNLTGREETFALVDMIDGTDLLERGLSNWCSAAVFFRPSEKVGERILASCVGLPTGEIYYAHAQSSDVYVKQRLQFDRPVAKPSNIKELKEASICFYGQKALNLAKTSEQRLFQHLIDLSTQIKVRREEKENRGEQLTAEDGDITSRFYNLAGIPMMVKLIDHRIKIAKNIDAVFDVRGQKPHDVVPGAFLALIGGAVMWNLNTSTYATRVDLEKALLEPAAKSMRYIIACTKELCEQMQPLLRPVAKGAV